MLLFLATTGVGMVLAAGPPSGGLLLATLTGVALTVGGAATLNEFLERDLDARMARTAGRPLPAGRLRPRPVLLFGLALCVLGGAELALAVRPAAALLAAAGAAHYAVLYTLVLKPRSPQGAIPGGLAGVFPPLIGWTATGVPWSTTTLYLCALVFFWSPPHFWSLTLARNADYMRAGLPTLPAAYGETHTRARISAYVLAVVGISLLPVATGVLGTEYLVPAGLAGAAWVGQLLRVMLSRTPQAAFALHKLSGLYLVLVLAAMAFARLV
ncbi:MAG: hypothetical protein Kow00122_03750 [Thermoleophilia bacterium]